jgi:ParB/RepB/Spo0J family partition protein
VRLQTRWFNRPNTEQNYISQAPGSDRALDFQEVYMLSTQTCVVQIPVTLITPNPKQPRKRFNPEELANLTNSVREHGVIQPLLVCPAGQDGIHILIAGERRLRAAKGAKLKTVPAILRDVNPDDLAVLALVENVIRDDISPVEEGDAYLELRRKGRSNSEIARMIGTNDVRVANCINCASLPDRTREMVHAGTLFKSSDFISVMAEIAKIDSAACDELANEIVKKQPGLKAAKKSAEGVLAYLRNLDIKKSMRKGKSAPVLEVASFIAKTDIDEGEPQGWNVLQQAGDVPQWRMLTQVAIDVCKRCELRDIASPQMCSACTAAQLLAEMATLAQDNGKGV